MKTKWKIIGVNAAVFAFVLTVSLWTCWTMAYEQGYKDGAMDEYSHWELEPIKTFDTWDGLRRGHRHPLAPAIGFKTRPRSGYIAGIDVVNSIPSQYFPETLKP